jgi:predicted acylesterase/phospholipase RssA
VVELRAAVGLLASQTADAIARHWPPWWAWAAVAAGLLVAGWIVRRASLRALDVAPPNDAERARAAAAGQELAARGSVGLVLGGGGAKGAYQVGCWKALRECGLAQFGALAGTSVGALNAVLVAQDAFERAERIWHDMRFGRVLRLRWHAPLALAIRLVLFVPYLGKFAFPDRFIPVALFRAVDGWQQGWRTGEPQQALGAALELYAAFVKSPRSIDHVSQLVLAGLVLGGFSAGWMLAAPLLTLVAMVVVAPFGALLVVNYASWLATLLDQLATRLVVASNGPLAELLHECVDPPRLAARPQPVVVTLAALREVTRTPPLRRLAVSTAQSTGRASARPPDRDFCTNPDFSAARLPSTESTIEYVPDHFDVRTQPPARMRELILQSAGLPEIFPARRFGDRTYVDGGLADNEPLTALVGVPGQATIIVVPLNARCDEARVRTDLRRNLDRLGRPEPTALPDLLVLTPSRPLGNLLTGTMDFGAARARALMRLGYRDTIIRLAARDGG